MREHDWTLVIHGGAGVIERRRLAAEKDREIRSALDHALATGAAILERGGEAIDAVEAAVRELEDNPNFNAGCGAVFTFEGGIEHDSAIMDGRDRSAGAVTGVTRTRHPVSLARAVMEKSPHVLLRGIGADEFAIEQGLEQVPNAWFETPERRRQLEEMKARGGSAFDFDLKYGTVGAVARDAHGHLAAATSTGGLTNKHPGRVGDTPLIGAGTFADDRSVALSCTGTGEAFIRAGFGFHVHARMALSGLGVEPACAEALELVRGFQGRGGCIAIDREGHVALPFNSRVMFRAWVGADDRLRVAVGRDDAD